MYVDNYYVKILTENGIVGVTAFGMMLLGLVGNGLRACVRTAKTRWSPLCAGMLCGLIGVLIHSVFEHLGGAVYDGAVLRRRSHDGLGRSAAPPDTGNRLKAYVVKCCKICWNPNIFCSVFIFLQFMKNPWKNVKKYLRKHLFFRRGRITMGNNTGFGRLHHIKEENV